MSDFIKVGNHIIRKEYIYDVYVYPDLKGLVVFSNIPYIKEKNCTEFKSVNKMDVTNLAKEVEDILLKDDPKGSDNSVGFATGFDKDINGC